MRQTVVLNVVGLTPSLLGAHTPHLKRLAERGVGRPLRTVTPAVTCPAQATFLTGVLPRDHGCVGNGWYFRDLSEVLFWRQSNRLMQGEKLWQAARRRDPDFTCAVLFWWFNMFSDADWTVTPRPMYPADGRKIPDIHTHPSGLRDELNGSLGPFPLFNFWGPAASIVSSAWIMRAAKHLFESRAPTLSLVYLPHLDYNLQRLGPNDPKLAKDLRDVDALCGQLIEMADRAGARIIVLSEYGVTPVSGAVHINRVLRREGLIEVRQELGRELPLPGASRAFAVADHQVAHIYVREPQDIGAVRALLEGLDGIEEVLGEDGKHRVGLDHERSGDLVAISRPDRWFSYYHWLEDEKAPDYARTVDIHRKPGYDPVELFLDPAIPLPKAAIGWRLLKKKLGLRTLMDVIPLDAGLVKGSHGRPTDAPQCGPLIISSEANFLPGESIHAMEVKDLILQHVFGG